MSIDLRERISKKEKKAVFYSSKLSNRPNIKRLSLDKVVECLSSTKADVFVISCYYGFETIQKFFDKIYGKQENQQETTVIVSSQGNSLDRMISILNDLVKIIFKNYKRQKLFIYQSSSLLHTKLYISMNCNVTKNTCCLVGSLNLSDNAFLSNEEILVDVTDVKDKKAASDYFDSICNSKKLIDVGKIQKELKDKGIKEESIYAYLKNKYTEKVTSFADDSIKDFISAGYLYFKAQRNFSLTYRQNSLWDKWLSNIDKKNRENVIPHTKNPRLNVYDLLGIEEEVDDVDKILVKQNAVETNLGYWVPAGRRHDLIQKKIDEIRSDRMLRYESIVKILEDNKNKLSKKTNDNLTESFDGLNALLPKEKKLHKADFVKLKKEFLKYIKEKFVSWKSKKMKDMYEKNGVFFSSMPNFWDDTPAVENFMDSFYEDMISRHTKNGKTKVVDVLYEFFKMKDELNQDGINLNKKLEHKWNLIDKKTFSEGK